MLPEQYTKLFWEYNSSELSLDKHRNLIISRILEKGNFPAISWLVSYYGVNEITTFCKSTKSLSKKTQNFWVKLLTF